MLGRGGKRAERGRAGGRTGRRIVGMERGNKGFGAARVTWSLRFCLVNAQFSLVTEFQRRRRGRTNPQLAVADKHVDTSIIYLHFGAVRNQLLRGHATKRPERPSDVDALWVLPPSDSHPAVVARSNIFFDSFLAKCVLWSGPGPSTTIQEDVWPRLRLPVPGLARPRQILHIQRSVRLFRARRGAEADSSGQRASRRTGPVDVREPRLKVPRVTFLLLMNRPVWPDSPGVHHDASLQPAHPQL